MRRRDAPSRRKARAEHRAAGSESEPNPRVERTVRDVGKEGGPAQLSIDEVVALSPEAARAEVVRLRALMREQRVGLEPGPGPGAAALAEESQRKTKEAAEIQAAAEQRRNSVIASADQKALFVASQQKKVEKEAAEIQAAAAKGKDVGEGANPRKTLPKTLPTEPGFDDKTTFHYANSDTKLGAFHLWLLCEVDPADGTRLTPRIVLQHVSHRTSKASTTRLIGEYAGYQKFMIDIRWTHVACGVDITDLPPDATAETLGASPIGQVRDMPNKDAKEWASRFKCIAFERGGVSVDNRGGKMLLYPLDDQGLQKAEDPGDGGGVCLCYDMVTAWGPEPEGY